MLFWRATTTRAVFSLMAGLLVHLFVRFFLYLPIFTLFSVCDISIKSNYLLLLSRGNLVQDYVSFEY